MPVSLSLQVLGLTILPPVQCYTNNASLTSIPETLIIVNDRRLRADIVRLKEMISEENVKVCWVDGKLHLVDSLTEIGASILRLIEVLGTSQLKKFYWCSE